MRIQKRTSPGTLRSLEGGEIGGGTGGCPVKEVERQWPVKQEEKQEATVP